MITIQRIETDTTRWVVKTEWSLYTSLWHLPLQYFLIYSLTVVQFSFQFCCFQKLPLGITGIYLENGFYGPKNIRLLNVHKSMLLSRFEVSTLFCKHSEDPWHDWVEIRGTIWCNLSLLFHRLKCIIYGMWYNPVRLKICAKLTPYNFSAGHFWIKLSEDNSTCSAATII